MRKITRKSEVRIHLATAIAAFQRGGIAPLLQSLDQNLLSYAVKFPLLEFVTDEISKVIKTSQHVELATKISDLQKEGGNVVIGILMRNYARRYRRKAYGCTKKYIDQGRVWYTSDLIGERVFGNGLLEATEETLDFYRKTSQAKSIWVCRALGAGGHFAVKRGLNVKDVELLFQILLTMGNTNEKEIRQGVGWGQKPRRNIIRRLLININWSSQMKIKSPTGFEKK